MFSVLYETVTGFFFVLPWMLSQCCRIGSNTVTPSVEQLYNLSELLNHTFKVRNIVNITSVNYFLWWIPPLSVKVGVNELICEALMMRENDFVTFDLL